MAPASGRGRFCREFQRGASERKDLAVATTGKPFNEAINTIRNAHPHSWWLLLR
jgi:hypothetical protein